MTIEKDLMKIGRREGLKNSADILDTSTFEGIKAEIEAEILGARDFLEIPEISLEEAKALPNIKEDFKDSELSAKRKEIVGEIRKFCAELSIRFGEKFLLLLDQYQKEKQRIPKQIIDYLKKHDFDLPTCSIKCGEKAEEALEDFGLSSYLEEGSFLIIFQLPKPLAQYWWKGGVGIWGDKSKDVGDAIEWGEFYRKLMPSVWETRKFYSNEKDLEFRTINDMGQHDPKKYYYVWEVYRKY